MPKRAKFAIVIKTDTYAGNFEREMCAHLTGAVGDCEVGEEYVDDSIQKLFEVIIGNEADDNGCYRPVALGCDIKGYTNQDVVIFFNEKPTKEHIETITERVSTFEFSNYNGIKEPKEIFGVDMVEFVTKQTQTKIS